MIKYTASSWFGAKTGPGDRDDFSSQSCVRSLESLSLCVIICKTMGLGLG